jgi:hypothetical protein
MEELYCRSQHAAIILIIRVARLFVLFTKPDSPCFFKKVSAKKLPDAVAAGNFLQNIEGCVQAYFKGPLS